MSRRSALALAAGVPLSLLVSKQAAGTGPAIRYTMTSFTNADETDLHVYESSDGLDFRPLRGPTYRPPTGLLRDPCLFRHRDGAYYLAYTTAWEGRTIGFARSADRRRWNHLCDIDIEIEGVTSTWAPEWLVDAQGQVNVLVSLSDGCCFTPHLMTATDSSLRSWTTPVPIDGLATCVAPDPAAPPDMPRCAAYGYIDTTVVQHDGRYFAFTKNETTKFVELAVAPTPLGPYTFLRQGDWAGWGTPREGQSVIPLPDGGWRIFFDAYTERRYYFSDSYDDFETWTPPAELPKLSGIVRHFTVLAEYPQR